ncbi:MAG: 16S rRNA (cytidine(1402)-2'-O)-methyltransferase [Pedosphaera sp.]|nr:16S rRNA (cytidine(1402)-2'-O)-methyltransferase [Pedosphaera sp.]
MANDLPPLTPGTLYLVATPIGNLEDITLRALRVLRGADVIAAEDTRHTGNLLRHFSIQKPLISYFKFNEARRGEEILDRLRQGQIVALVTDAGTPGISDPGQRVVASAVRAELRVEAIPGACALIAALTASGLPTDEFHFAGFLPVKSGQRSRRLAELVRLPGTIVLYESPYRVEKLVTELAVLSPDRPLVLARELTKKFEELLRGRPADVIAEWKRKARKGEFVVLIGPNADDSSNFGNPQAGTHTADNPLEPKPDLPPAP